MSSSLVRLLAPPVSGLDTDLLLGQLPRRVGSLLSLHQLSTKANPLFALSRSLDKPPRPKSKAAKPSQSEERITKSLTSSKSSTLSKTKVKNSLDKLGTKGFALKSSRLGPRISSGADIALKSFGGKTLTEMMSDTGDEGQEEEEELLSLDEILSFRKGKKHTSPPPAAPRKWLTTSTLEPPPGLKPKVGISMDVDNSDDDDGDGDGDDLSALKSKTNALKRVEVDYTDEEVDQLESDEDLTTGFAPARLAPSTNLKRSVPHIDDSDLTKKRSNIGANFSSSSATLIQLDDDDKAGFESSPQIAAKKADGPLFLPLTPNSSPSVGGGRGVKSMKTDVENHETPQEEMAGLNDDDDDMEEWLASCVTVVPS
jgi:hypothetical protein